MTIASLVVSLVAQHEAFTSGMRLAGEGVEGFTRTHLSMRKVVEETTTPFEREQKQVEQLNKWMELGKLSAEQYARAMEKVHEQFTKSTEAGGGFLDQLHGFGDGVTHILEVVGAAELARKAFEEIKQAFEDVGNMGRSALRLGIDVEDMSRLTHAAHEAHADISAVELGFNRLNKAIGEVIDGGAKPAAEAFARLHIDATRLAQESPIQAFEEVAAAIDRETSAYQRAADVIAIFGRGGASLIPIMHDLRDSMAEADKIGFTRTAEEVERVEASERRMATLTDTFKAKWMDIASSDIVNEALGLPVQNTEKSLTHIIELLGGPLSQALARHIQGMPDEQKTTGFLELLGGPVSQALGFMLQTPGAAAVTTLNQVHDATARVSDSFEKMAESAVHTVTPIERQVDALQKLIDKYADQAKTFGMSTEAADILRLQEMKNPFMTADFGTNLQAQTQFKQFEDMRKAAIQNADFMAALKEETKAQDDAARAAEHHAHAFDPLKKSFADIASLIKATESPLDKYRHQVDEIVGLFSAGMIDVEDFTKATQGAVKELEKAAEPAFGKKGGGSAKEIDPRFMDVRGLAMGGDKGEEEWRQRSRDLLEQIARSTQQMAQNPPVSP